MYEAIGLARDIFGPSALAAAIVSFAVVWLIYRALPAAAKDRFSVPVGISVGFFTGYWTIHGAEPPLVPKQSWQWLPYLGIAIALVALAPAFTRYERAGWLRLVIASIMAGCLLTPRWQIVSVPWPLTIGLAIAYLLLIAGVLESLPGRLIGWTLLCMLTFAAALSAAAIGAEVSIKYAQLAGIAAGSLAAAMLASMIAGSPMDSAIRASIPLYAVLVGGIAFIATVEPEKPLVSLLLPPLAPAVMWAGIAIRRPHGRLPPN